MALSLHLVALTLLAHPVPIQNYDRSITVRLTPAAVTVAYILEVDSQTAVKDVPSLVGKEEMANIFKADQVHEAFARASAPILAKQLDARLDSQRLSFKLKQRKHLVLDHLRCEYVFEAEWKPSLEKEQIFTFEETNFFEEPGSVRLSLEADLSLDVIASVYPDEELKKRPLIELRPGDEKRLRTASVRFKTTGEASAPAPQPNLGGSPETVLARLAPVPGVDPRHAPARRRAACRAFGRRGRSAHRATGRRRVRHARGGDGAPEAVRRAGPSRPAQGCRVQG